jgi:hypothetical protein
VPLVIDKLSVCSITNICVSNFLQIRINIYSHTHDIIAYEENCVLDRIFTTVHMLNNNEALHASIKIICEQK